MNGDVSAVNLSKQLEEMGDVTDITVYINSYGGEVAEGLAIYNSLKRHKATIKTVCDGFACSIASVIFMAGDERIMNDSSLLMIHNAWTWAEGNAEQLRKQADDLEKITSASIVAYKAHSSLSEDEIKALLDAETWITPSEAIEYGFATAIEKTEARAANQSVKKCLFEIIKQHAALQAEAEENKDEDEDEDEEAPKPEKEPDTSDEDEEKPDDEEASADDDTADEDDSEDEDEQEKATQRWSGFFNALLNM